MCHLCGRCIDITLAWPHRWSFSVHHIDGNKNNNHYTNHAATHLRCNIRHGNTMRRTAQQQRVSPQQQLIVDVTTL